MLKLYTDGSAYWRNRSAGRGFVLVKNGEELLRMHGSLPPGTSVQQAELLAVVSALRAMTPGRALTVVSDSTYVVKTMNQYGRSWLVTALQKYSIAPYPRETLLDLYRMYRNVIGKHAALDLEKSDGTPVKNQKILEMLWKELLGRNVQFEWIPGHSGNEWNDLADDLARKGRMKCIEDNNLIAKERNRRIT